MDISPYSMKDIQGETKKMVERGQYALKFARDYGPVVMFIDSVDEYYTNKQWKNIVKKVLGKDMKKTLTFPQILVIATVHRPISTKGDLKKLKKGFKSFAGKLFFPLPQFAELKSIWQKYIETKINIHNSVVEDENEKYRMDLINTNSMNNPDLDDLAPIVNKFNIIDLNYGEFRIDSLAEVSYGYTGGSIRACVEAVMTNKRLEIYNKMPISVTDFVEKLSYTQ